MSAASRLFTIGHFGGKNLCYGRMSGGTSNALAPGLKGPKQEVRAVVAMKRQIRPGPRSTDHIGLKVTIEGKIECFEGRHVK